MAQLIVRHLDPRVVAELRKRAAQRGRSMEAEHREILGVALRRTQNRPRLKDLLLNMPAIGDAPDFARVPQRPRRVRL